MIDFIIKQMKNALSDKRGVTLMETLIAGALGIMVATAAMVAPIMMLKLTKSYGEVIDYREDLQIVITSMRHDMGDSNSSLSLTDNTITVGDKTYTFGEDGVYRDTQKISALYFEVEEHLDHIDLITEDPEKKEISVQFNYSQSSFSGGGINE